ncbi:hypothetical protein HDU88_002374 [Geranomyces variabilis]|nr:hypothetical protein HDU88_002374 [Geranomyces variabilis]
MLLALRPSNRILPKKQPPQLRPLSSKRAVTSPDLIPTPTLPCVPCRNVTEPASAPGKHQHYRDSKTESFTCVHSRHSSPPLPPAISASEWHRVAQALCEASVPGEVTCRPGDTLIVLDSGAAQGNDLVKVLNITSNEEGFVPSIALAHPKAAEAGFADPHQHSHKTLDERGGTIRTSR